MIRRHHTNTCIQQIKPPTAAPALPMLCLIILSFTGSAYAQETVQHGGMRLILPDQPINDSIDLGDGTKQHRLIMHRPNGSIIVWHQDANPQVPAKAGLQKAQDTIVKMAGGKVLSESQDKVDGQPARTFTVTMPSQGGEFRVGYYYANGKNYQVMSVGTPEFTRSGSVNKMFESVRFTK